MMQSWQSISDAFHTAARDHASLPALHTADGSVQTYAEVRQAVEILAERLFRHIREAETLVALSLPRSTDWVVGALATWWAGAAFVPLDPTGPPYRRDFILRDAAPAVILTTGAYADQMAVSGLPLLQLPSETFATRNILEPRTLAPNHLAYRIYTSGTSGQPKGVDIEHRGLVPLLRAQIEAFDLRPGDRALWLHSPNFDASLSDIGTTLLSGAALVIEPETDLRDPVRLVAILHQRQITHVDIPPSLLCLLDPEAMPASLRTLIIGGEPCPTPTVQAWARRFRIVNVYGPTEATICSSLCICDANDWREPLLGQPTPGVRYFLLGKDRQPLTGRGVGELAIAGVGLARGYHRLPERTARQFIRNGGERLYRTGDRVQRRADEEYVFLGRLDRQVKVNGQRLELDEVEAVLLQHPSVNQAVVLQRHLGEGSARRHGLIAFLAPATPTPTDAELREFLSARLPAWMVPVRFMRLEVLPRTASGKADLSALAEWPLDIAASAELPDPFGLEELGKLLSFFLGVARIDWQASFQDHGGDSLTLLRVAQAAHARCMNLAPGRLASVRRLVDVAEETTFGLDGMPADDLRRDVETFRPPSPLGGEGLGVRGFLSGQDEKCKKYPSPPTPLPQEERGADQVPIAQARGRRCIVLTGATGFLGSYLVGEFLRQTTARIVCLVRAANPDRGRQRLLEAQPAVRRRAAVEEAGDRLDVVCGDLTLPRLGLDASSWMRLAEAADLIVHNAARVNLLDDYTTLRPANLVGTNKIVQLCSFRGAQLAYVSSLAVFVSTDRVPGRFLETDDLTTTNKVFGGYAQTKWAAEWLVRRSAEQTGGCLVFRPGLVTGDSETGVAAGTDHLGLFLRGLAQLGCLPELDAERLRFDVTPVDYAAAALAHLTWTMEPMGIRTFHLAGRRTASLAELLAAVHAAGVAVETVSWSEWRRRLGDLEKVAPATAAACFALARAMPQSGDLDRYRSLDLFPAAGVTFDQSDTIAGLNGSGLACPLPSPELLGRYVAFALRSESFVENAT